MIDAEVTRLRRLRNTALNARALAAMLESSSSRRDSVFSRAAVRCWQIARVVTGRLRAHPYLSYQRGPSELAALYGGIRASLLSSAARTAGAVCRALSDDLQSVARELDDARALTWSTDLSDTFGRSQTQIRRLMAEIEAGARKEAGCTHEAESQAARLSRKKPPGGQLALPGFLMLVAAPRPSYAVESEKSYSSRRTPPTAIH